MSAPTGPVMGFRRWRVTPDGKLMGLGLDEVWETARQTAECKGTYSVEVAEYCSPQPPESGMDRFHRLSHQTYYGGLTGIYEPTPSRRPAYPLPDGRWVKLVTRTTCHVELDPGHAVPSLKSLCGLWAHKQPVPDCTCPEPEADRHGAVGVVRMWGKAVEHEDGWRAEHAELVAVVDHSRRLRDYGVPVYGSTAAMYAEWAPDADGWAARHDQNWCGFGSWHVGVGPHGQLMASGSGLILTFYGNRFSGPSPYSGAVLSAMQQMAGASPLSSASLRQIWSNAPVPADDDEADDPKAKALRDKQTRNVDHPGQDRPDKQKRKRKWR